MAVTTKSLILKTCYCVEGQHLVGCHAGWPTDRSVSLHGKTGLLIKSSEDGSTGFGGGSVVGHLHRCTSLGWGHEPGGCGGQKRER